MKELMKYCESQRDVRDYYGVPDGKHFHVLCYARVVMNFITVRMATECAVNKGNISLY
jgi:hypothetical protein